MQPNKPPPQIAPAELVEWMKTEPGLIILDVREPYETRYVRIEDARVLYLPLSVLASQEEPQLPDQVQDKDARVIVVCHLGERSAQVTGWMHHLGWKNVYNLAGGIDAYARQIDPEIGFY